MKMSIENSLPKRKELRLKQFNYSSAGAYFVTICIKDRKRILSNIVKSADGADPKTVLTEIGKIVEKNLLSSENIPGVKIDRYVIMPDHIHAIIYLYPMERLDENGSSRAPTPTIGENRRFSTLTQLNSQKVKSGTELINTTFLFIIIHYAPCLGNGILNRNFWSFTPKLYIHTASGVRTEIYVKYLQAQSRRQRNLVKKTSIS